MSDTTQNETENTQNENETPQTLPAEQQVQHVVEDVKQSVPEGRIVTQADVDGILNKLDALPELLIGAIREGVQQPKQPRKTAKAEPPAEKKTDEPEKKDVDTPGKGKSFADRWFG